MYSSAALNKIVDFLREIENYCNRQDQNNGQKESPKELPDHIEIQDFQPKRPYNLVLKAGIIFSFHGLNVPFLISSNALRTSQR